MTKVKVTNHNLKILQFLLDEGMISEGFLSVTADLCLRQAKANLEKELNTRFDQSAFDEKIRAEVV
jgi:hypothetical protein